MLAFPPTKAGARGRIYSTLYGKYRAIFPEILFPTPGNLADFSFQGIKTTFPAILLINSSVNLTTLQY